MARKIAVEEGLSNIAQELERFGYQVVNLTNQNMREADAIVISGQDRNMMNREDITSKAQIIDARGLTAVQVRNELENRLI
ncbi:YkuS family protein [Halothermothrix orenii]|uniref:Uncharacterized protein family (UPF0180) n=1 Tax=Halothermothrix orenii (strain H 168 / OCM 544 / DSM 9562) TaxID=373903 RepID=B8D044_HALOH|nr:YkuS family protein [Halothermothrix orenii]ACL68798.1 Uncharacterized protein family (UPF0180) [Halothermothrix orenii H 168]